MKRNRRDLRLIFSIVGAFVIFAAFAYAVISRIPARSVSARNACIANLKQIEGAKDTWALVNKKKSTHRPLASDLYGTDLYIREEPTCPQGGVYTIGRVGETPRCDLNQPGHRLVGKGDVGQD